MYPQNPRWRGSSKLLQDPAAAASHPGSPVLGRKEREERVLSGFMKTQAGKARGWANTHPPCPCQMHFQEFLFWSREWAWERKALVSGSHRGPLGATGMGGGPSGGGAGLSSHHRIPPNGSLMALSELIFLTQFPDEISGRNQKVPSYIGMSDKDATFEICLYENIIYC